MLNGYRKVALRIAVSNGRTGIDRWAKKINNLTGYTQAREAPWIYTIKRWVIG